MATSMANQKIIPTLALCPLLVDIGDCDVVGLGSCGVPVRFLSGIVVVVVVVGVLVAIGLGVGIRPSPLHITYTSEVVLCPRMGTSYPLVSSPQHKACLYFVKAHPSNGPKVCTSHTSLLNSSFNTTGTPVDGVGMMVLPILMHAIFDVILILR
jgi:hypothetical protein